MDLAGAFALASMNAFGGRTLRDLLLANRPFFYWLASSAFFVAATGLRRARYFAGTTDTAAASVYVACT